MITFEEKKKLAIEASNLIREFEVTSENIRDPQIDEIKIIENIKKNSISIECEMMTFGSDVFELSEIHKIFSDEMEGFGPCGAAFYDAISEAKKNVEFDYAHLSDEECMLAVEEIASMEQRCEEIYDRLKKIAKLAK